MPKNSEENTPEVPHGLLDVESRLSPEVLATYQATLLSMQNSIRQFLSRAETTEELLDSELFIHNVIAGAAIQGYLVRQESE